MYKRLLEARLRSDKSNVLVLGPRQVGKSTLLSKLNPDLVIDLSSLSAFRQYAAHPEQLEAELLAAGPEIKTVMLDEVQRVPELLNAVQYIHDSNPGRFRFLLSGSSARKLRRGGSNLLAGRVHVQFLHPLVAAELAGDFRLDRYLAHGSLPGIYAESDAPTRNQTLRSYVDTYLREEVQAEALVRDVGAYSRLLDLVAASSGRVINLNSLCRDAGVSYETARRYLAVLEDTLLLFSIPAWRGSHRSSLIAHPRLMLFDNGVRNALLRRPLDRPAADERGYLLEHLLAQELHRRAGSLWPEARLFHFRTRHGAKVDLVLEVGRELWGIEVKAAGNVTRRDLQGLSALEDRARKLVRKVVVFLGPRRQVLDGVEILPLAGFLQQLPA